MRTSWNFKILDAILTLAVFFAANSDIREKHPSPCICVLSDKINSKHR